MHQVDPLAAGAAGKILASLIMTAPRRLRITRIVVTAHSLVTLMVVGPMASAQSGGANAIVVSPGAQSGETLPAPTDSPLAIELADDPIIGSTGRTVSSEVFRDVIGLAVARHPALAETAGYAQEARYLLYQQEAAQAPSAEITISGFQVFAREFAGSGLDNIVERTRDSRRFDQFASINQLVTDFGATSSRIDAAGSRLRAAALGVDDTASRVSLNAIAAWYDVYTLRSILALSSAYRRDQQFSREAIAERVAEGASAEVDTALVDNSLAQIDIRIARFRQQLASAEARFRELTGAEPPADLLRAPPIGVLPATVEAARLASLSTPAARAARFQAQAADKEARAARRDLLPSVTASVNAGRYGLFEPTRDYDVVGQVTLRQRLFGGLPQRARALEAGAEAADARAFRIEEENARDAALAFTELQSYNQQLASLEKAYLATRITRDAVVERFRYSRGTLFEVIDASDAFYAAATSYLQTLAQRDASRYVLLANTGGLLDALRIAPYVAEPFND
jgi:outer membrane protein, adhesin transport system